MHRREREGDGEREGEREGEEGDREKHTPLDDSSEDGDKDEVQRSLLGNNEDVNATEEEHCHGGREKEHHGQRERDDASVPKRTVLHTYSVFISNTGAPETERESFTVKHNSSPSDLDIVHSRSDEGCCRFSVKDETVTIEETSTAVAGGGERGKKGRRMEGEREEETERSVVVCEEVNVSWRTKVIHVLVATLKDLKLFLW